MFFSKVRYGVLSVVAGFACLLTVSCGVTPTKSDSISTGALEMQIHTENGGLAKSSSLKATRFDSLVVELSGEDGTELRFVQSIDPMVTTITDTIESLPTGVDFEVTVTTINEAGEVIHEDANGIRTVRINPDVITVLEVMLVPTAGSVFLQIADIPTSIDSIYMRFTSDEGKVWEKMVSRSPKLSVSIDNIPHHTKGVLYVAALDELRDTVCSADAALEIDAHSVSSGVVLDFSEGPGGFALSGSLIIPGASVVVGSMGDVEVAATESGELVITEIMYAANDSEYIELYNPSENERVFSSLIVDVDGTSREYANVTVAGHGYVTIGRCALPWVDHVVPGTTGMDLSGNGNWITVSGDTGEVLDQVAFTGGKNEIDWPRLSGKRSVYLKEGFRDADKNNFGRNWAGSEMLIQGSQSQYGSPHS